MQKNYGISPSLNYSSGNVIPKIVYNKSKVMYSICDGI